MSDENAACVNTDRELWREREGDYYADSIHVTADGAIGINHGGHVIVMTLTGWHAAALATLRAAGAPEDRKRAEALLRRIGKHPWPSYVDAILAAFAEERERCAQKLEALPLGDVPVREMRRLTEAIRSAGASAGPAEGMPPAESQGAPTASGEPTTIDDYRDAYGRMATQAADLQERIEDLETELRAANGALSEANTSLVWVTSEEGARSRRIVDNAMARINSLLGDAPARAAAPEPLREAPHAVIPGFDAREWVALWRKTIAEHPGIPTDDDTMLTWFANAIMRGYDEARALAAAPSEQPPLAEPSPPTPQASETPAEGEVWKALDTAYLRCITCGYNLSNSEWWKFTRLKTCWCAPLRALLARRPHGR